MIMMSRARSVRGEEVCVSSPSVVKQQDGES